MKNGYPDGYMWTGSGDRYNYVEVKFPEPFDKVPKVVASIGKIDFRTPQGALSHLVTDISKVDKDGFTIRFWTWGTCAVGQATAVWIAVDNTE